MNTQEKSLELAKLMHWKLGMSNGRPPTYRTIVRTRIGIQTRSYLEPYSESECGLAQFAAILLKFPEVIEEFVCTASHTDEQTTIPDRYKRYRGDYQGYLTTDRPVTQEALLDAVLKMKKEQQVIKECEELPRHKASYDTKYSEIKRRDGTKETVPYLGLPEEGIHEVTFRTPEGKTRTDTVKVWRSMYGWAYEIKKVGSTK